MCTKIWTRANCEELKRFLKNIHLPQLTDSMRAELEKPSLQKRFGKQLKK